MDLDRILDLLKLMEAHSLGELELEDGDFKVRLKKAIAASAAMPLVPAVPSAPIAGAAGASAQAECSTARTITSPIVGTFYRAPSAEAEPFVEVGDPVEADTVICIIEAMKVMNEVKAEVPGTIQKILVESGKPVEYGQPLFLVATS
jgi:acetyl-CoA carboxylase biotin carboxyl carrier protein